MKRKEAQSSCQSVLDCVGIAFPCVWETASQALERQCLDFCSCQPNKEDLQYLILSEPVAYEIFDGTFGSSHLNGTSHFGKEKVWVHLLILVFIRMLDGSASPVGWKHLRRCPKTHWWGCPALLYSTQVTGSEVLGILYPTVVGSSTPLIAAYTTCNLVMCLWTTTVNQSVGQ